jgi:RNA polymerase sigma-70 factor (ECF subfamily)
MSESFPPGDHTRVLIERLVDGDDRACDELIRHAMGRIESLTRRMFRDFPRVGRWEQAEDVCQNASVRLWNALRATRPGTPAEFHRLAALQVRRELIDLARRHFGPEGIGAHHASNMAGDSASGTPPQPFDVAASTHDPAELSRWAEFHERAAELPDDQRAVFDLVWYQGLPQAEAAALLGISERTLKRRWLAARLTLGNALEGGSSAD